jgi:hypothetical protein
MPTEDDLRRVVPKKPRVERRDVLAVRVAELLTAAWRAKVPRAFVAAYDANQL